MNHLAGSLPDHMHDCLELFGHCLVARVSAQDMLSHRQPATHHPATLPPGMGSEALHYLEQQTGRINWLCELSFLDVG